MKMSYRLVGTNIQLDIAKAGDSDLLCVASLEVLSHALMLQCVPGDSDDDSAGDMSDDSEDEDDAEEPLLAIEKKARLLDRKR